MPKSKKRKPSFNVAHVEIEEDQTGWVYRSDAAAAAPPPSDSPAGIAVSYLEPNQPSTQVTFELPHGGGGWVETGARVLVFPLACAFVAMAAPVLWMMASREQQ